MKKLSVLALFLMLFSFQAEAQVKIGYTNPEVILSQLPEVESIQQEIGDMLERKDSLLAIQALALQKSLKITVQLRMLCLLNKDSKKNKS